MGAITITRCIGASECKKFHPRTQRATWPRPVAPTQPGGCDGNLSATVSKNFNDRPHNSQDEIPSSTPRLLQDIEAEPKQQAMDRLISSRTEERRADFVLGLEMFRRNLPEFQSAPSSPHTSQNPMPSSTPRLMQEIEAEPKQQAIDRLISSRTEERRARFRSYVPDRFMVEPDVNAPRLYEQQQSCSLTYRAAFRSCYFPVCSDGRGLSSLRPWSKVVGNESSVLNLPFMREWVESQELKMTRYSPTEQATARAVNLPFMQEWIEKQIEMSD